jgi:hypothetical protein
VSERETLKPCPFCGSEKVDTFFVRDGRRAGCGCGASLVRFNGPGDTDAEVRRAWNTRARPEPSEAVVEAVARVLCEIDIRADAMDWPDTSAEDVEADIRQTIESDWPGWASRARAAMAAYEAERGK